MARFVGNGDLWHSEGRPAISPRGAIAAALH
jgi:hypothetical protein